MKLQLSIGVRRLAVYPAFRELTRLSHRCIALGFRAAFDIELPIIDTPETICNGSATCLLS